MSYEIGSRGIKHCNAEPSAVPPLKVVNSGEFAGGRWNAQERRGGKQAG